ncbi:hypothetical protein AAFX26_15885 (plasmid) [Vibrio alginolyticus]|uniref:hypothetical protein n=1 Tax=Vibrio alginolyticus TaxID=663 RepID=UPI0038CD6394
MNSKIELKTVLSTFTCDDSDPRAFLRQPFNYGEYTYFTDGHVMARIPKEEGHPSIPEEKQQVYQDSINRFFSSFYKGKFFPLPPVPEITKHTCTECDGSGKMTQKKCHECDGWGEVDAETAYNTYEVPCKSCNETGYIRLKGGEQDCENCEGTGETPKFRIESMRVDGGLLSLKMAHRIKRLPNLKIARISDVFFGLKFDGGTGVVAAVQDPDSIAPQQTIETKCSCGEAISIELNAPFGGRKDKKRPFYPDQELPEGADPTAYSKRGISVFRCRKCGEPVSETVPEASYDNNNEEKQ